MPPSLKRVASSALRSAGPAADRADRMSLYAFLIGDWAFDAIVHKDDGALHKGKGEIHAIWALDGRAIQDVWILPGFFYGTTLRIYDPALDAWHIHWNDPLKQYYPRQIGRARGRDIVQDGTTEDGTPVRGPFEPEHYKASAYSRSSQSVTASWNRRHSLRLIVVNACMNCSPST